MNPVVFSGGSSYGEEPITAVMTGLKEDGIRGGTRGNIAFSTGAIIYDFQGHRLNEVYPDKRLAQAALHDLRPGVFPLGAQGAGRMAMQGASSDVAPTRVRGAPSAKSLTSKLRLS